MAVKIGLVSAVGLGFVSGSAAQTARQSVPSVALAAPAGTVTIGPGTLASSGTSTLQNDPNCTSLACTYIQWSGSEPDSSYSSPVAGTIVDWRISSGSAGNKVALRVLRPVGGGKYMAVGTSATETVSGNPTTPDEFSTNLPVQAGDIIGLDNSSDALIFETGVLGAFPEFWTPQTTDGSAATAPTTPSGSSSNGYQLQIDAYVQPTPPATTTTTATTTTATTTTTTTTASVPTAPRWLAARFANNILTLTWKASSGSAPIADYELYRNGAPLEKLAKDPTKTELKGYAASKREAFRLRAFDTAGKPSNASAAIIVTPLPEPAGTPKPLPAWAPALLRWQTNGGHGKRPVTPTKLPSWYARWKTWKLDPYRSSQ